MVLGLPLLQGRLVDLYLFVQEIGLSTPSYQLGPQNVSFTYYQLVLFLKLLLLVLNLLDNGLQFVLLDKKVFYLLFFLDDVLLELLYLLLLVFNFFVLLVVLSMLLHQVGLLCVDLFLELSYLMGHSLIPIAVLFFLLLDLRQLFGDQVSVRPHSLVQRLLFLEFGLGFDVLFLELSDKVISEFDFISGVKIFGFG